MFGGSVRLLCPVVVVSGGDVTWCVVDGRRLCSVVVMPGGDGVCGVQWQRKEDNCEPISRSISSAPFLM